MASLNKVLLIGRLTRDPELRHTPSGMAVADLGLAVNRFRKDASGQRQEETCFIDVTAWGKTAELASQYLRKGREVFIEGYLKFEQWEKDGQKRSKLKVIVDNLQFLGNKDGGAAQSDNHSERDFGGPAESKSDRDDFAF